MKGAQRVPDVRCAILVQQLIEVQQLYHAVLKIQKGISGINVLGSFVPGF